MKIFILNAQTTVFVNEDLTGQAIGRSVNNALDNNFEVQIINNIPNPNQPGQFITQDGPPTVLDYQRFNVYTPTKNISFVRSDITDPVFASDEELGAFLLTAVYPPLV